MNSKKPDQLSTERILLRNASDLLCGDSLFDNHLANGAHHLEALESVMRALPDGEDYDDAFFNYIESNNILYDDLSDMVFTLVLDVIFRCEFELHLDEPILDAKLVKKVMSLKKPITSGGPQAASSIMAVPANFNAIEEAMHELPVIEFASLIAPIRVLMLNMLIECTPDALRKTRFLLPDETLQKYNDAVNKLFVKEVLS